MKSPRQLLVSAFIAIALFIVPADAFAGMSDGTYLLTEKNYGWEDLGLTRYKSGTGYSPIKFYGDENSVAHTFFYLLQIKFYGTIYSGMVVDTNGNIWFGNVDQSNLPNSFDLATTGPVISVWNNDLSSHYKGGVFIEYPSVGKTIIRWVTESFEDQGSGRISEAEVVLYYPHGIHAPITIEINYKNFTPSTDTDFDSGISDGNGKFLKITDLYGPVPTLGQSSYIFTEYYPSSSDTDGDGDTDDIDPDDDGDDMDDSWETLYGLNPLSPLDKNEHTDPDGLTNYEEYLIGTNPTLADTDSNGTNDDQEDFDADELTNLLEFQIGTEPLIADTDTDNMPDGWEHNNDLNPLDDADALVDSDTDGLINKLEYHLRSMYSTPYFMDPWNPDSDDDGTDDGPEFFGSMVPIWNMVLNP